MKRCFIVCIILAIIPIMGACRYAPDENNTSVGENDQGLPEANAARVWKYMAEANHNDGWGVWPGYDGMVAGKSPQGSYVRIYGNALALNALRTSDLMPYGAVLVKESYGEDKKLKFIMPMYKVKGYNPRAGDWFWAQYHPNGRILASGKVTNCINCHGNRKENDWLYSEWKITP